MAGSAGTLSASFELKVLLMVSLGGIARKIFGSSNDRRVKATRPRVVAINALENEIRALSDEELRALLVGAGIEVTSWGVVTRRRRGEISRAVKCELKWRGRPDESRVPAVIERLVERAGVKDLRWQG